MFDWIINFEFNSLLGILLFWSPLLMCVYGYTIRTWCDYRNDIKQRLEDDKRQEEWNNQTHEHGETLGRLYYPRLTIGDIIGRGFASIIPVVNLWAACFDVAPEIFKTFFNWLGNVFDQPLVPKNK